MVQHAVDEIILQGKENKKFSMKDETHENIDSEVDEYELYELDKIIIDEKRWWKGAFESEHKNVYDKNRPNGINHIHENEVNKRAKFNLLHDILNPSKGTKNINIRYTPTLHDVWIHERVNRNLRTFRSYWVVDVVPRFYWEG